MAKHPAGTAMEAALKQIAVPRPAVIAPVTAPTTAAPGIERRTMSLFQAGLVEGLANAKLADGKTAFLTARTFESRASGEDDEDGVLCR
jgi:hypothetical protein